MARLAFTVEGRPISKGRPRVTRWGTFTPQRTRDHEEAIAWAARDAMARLAITPFEGDVCVEATFYVAGTADLDNLAKALLDGLNGVAFQDDRQVTQLVLRRVSCKRPDQRTYAVVTEATG